MKNRVLSLLIASTAAVCAISAHEKPKFWDTCKEHFNQFSTKAKQFSQAQYSIRKQQTENFLNSDAFRNFKNKKVKIITETPEKWNNPAGYVGALSGVLGLSATNRLFKTKAFRRFAPLTIATTFGVWAAQHGKGCVEAHFPMASSDQSAPTETMKKEA